MSKSIIEKEVKFEVGDPNVFIKNLRDVGAVFVGAVKEKTIRFDDSEKSYEQRGIFLRLRGGFSNTLTLKEKIGQDKEFKSRIETEFEVEDIEKMAYVLKKLGLDYIRIMEKFRMTWKYRDTTITIDELPFGIFTEIEGEQSNIVMISELFKFDLDKKIIVTYWDIFEEYKKRINSDAQDIIFPHNYELKLLYV